LDTLLAYNRRMSSPNTPRVFDWDKAARLIREKKPSHAGAGLEDDWEWTGGDIYRDGEPITDSYTYLFSTWAIPELEMDDELIECWVYHSDKPEWNQDTKWPESALKILRGENE
jgi:hypothetical protein